MVQYINYEKMRVMNRYFKLYNLNADEYDCMVVCLTYESLFSYIDMLQKAICDSGVSEGIVLIDQLLISGNSKNRFLEMKYSNGIFDYTSAKNTEVNKKYHQLTSYELKNNESLLKNSILSKRQIALIKKGCII